MRGFVVVGHLDGGKNGSHCFVLLYRHIFAGDPSFCNCSAVPVFLLSQSAACTASCVYWSQVEVSAGTPEPLTSVCSQLLR